MFRFFDTIMRRYTPDPYLFAILLSFLVFLLGIFVNGQSIYDMVYYWGNGFWVLIPFTLQMVMILVSGYIVASSKPVSTFLTKITSLAKTPGKAVVLLTLVSTIACWLNWGFGLIVGAFLCRALIKSVPTLNYRVLVASAYSGFLVWHGGFSGSIPLLLATPGNFSEQLVGSVLPLSQTLWSPLNISAVVGLLILLPITNYLMQRFSKTALVQVHEEEPSKEKNKPHTPAEHMENSILITLLTVALGVAYIIITIQRDAFSFDLNTVNFIFLFLGILLHGRPSSFLDASCEGTKKVAPILIQYPFYAGIMAMMQDSGLAASISNAFVAFASEVTFPLYTFFSAGIVNFFVPSGGGQWAVQSPIVIPAAKAIGANLNSSIMAVAWGDAWTNMAQPFWALPLLAIAGLRIRDIIGYTLGILIVSGVFLSFIFLIFFSNTPI